MANDFREVPRLFGIHRVVPNRDRERMVWGRPWMIQFLEALHREWIEKWMYSQREYRTDFAKIPLGDISRNGGGPPRTPDKTHPNHRLHGHLSHRDGVDVDLFYIGTDGMPIARRHPQLTGFDTDRTMELGFAILKAGGKRIERIFPAVAEPKSGYMIEGRRFTLLQAMQRRAGAIHPGIKWHTDEIHNNHFHVRLVSNI